MFLLVTVSKQGIRILGMLVNYHWNIIKQGGFVLGGEVDWYVIKQKLTTIR